MPQSGLYKGTYSGVNYGTNRGTASGMGYGLQSVTSPIYEAETIAWVKQLSSPPSPQYLYAVDALITSLKRASIWFQLDRLWIFATEQQAHAHVSLVNPNGINAPWPTILYDGPPNLPVLATWNANKGYTGNGSSMYLNTNYNPATNAKNLSLNSCSAGVYTTGTDTATSPFPIPFAIETRPGGTSYTLALEPWSWTGTQWQSSGGVWATTGPATTPGATELTQKGLFTVVRSNITTQFIANLGIVLATNQNASLQIPSGNIPIMVGNNRGTLGNWSSNTYSMFYAGSGTIDQVEFYNIFQIFAKRVGFSVGA